MKFGFFGGAILLVLTLIFSYIAIQNNKMAREISLNAFDLKPQEVKFEKKQVEDLNITSEKNNDLNKTIAVEELPKKKTKWDKFDEKFEDFDKKFEDF